MGIGWMAGWIFNMSLGDSPFPGKMQQCFGHLVASNLGRQMAMLENVRIL
jgi:hypothetical protein